MSGRRSVKTMLLQERTGTALQVAEASLNLEGVSDVQRGMTVRKCLSSQRKYKCDSMSGRRMYCVPT